MGCITLQLSLGSLFTSEILSLLPLIDIDGQSALMGLNMGKLSNKTNWQNISRNVYHVWSQILCAGRASVKSYAGILVCHNDEQSRTLPIIVELCTYLFSFCDWVVDVGA
jgi:hypothetical protein